MIKDNITIPMEEYKDLLITKGKYEELKSQKTGGILPVYRNLEKPKLPDEYKVTCATL